RSAATPFIRRAFAPATDVPQHHSRARADRLPLQRARLRFVVRPVEPERRGTRPMPHQLHRIVADMAARSGHAPALTFKDTTLSYAELWREIEAFAGGLQEIGLEREDRVGVYLDKQIETVVSIFGTSAAGGVFVPVNPVLKPGQVRYILDD